MNSECNMEDRQKLLQSARALLSQRLYGQCIRELQELDEKYGMSAVALIQKGICIQLLEEGDEWTLEDSRRAFEEALVLEPDNVRAMLELGFFFLNVLDDADGATRYFEDALTNSEEVYSECLLGLSLARSEIAERIQSESIQDIRKESADRISLIIASREVKV